MSALKSPAAVPPVVAFDGPLPAAPQYRPPPERVLGGDPVQRVWNLFSSVDGRFHSGIWECAVGRWRVAFTENEFCHLLAGVIAVIDDAGSERIFRAGESFVSPAGFTGIWEVREPARKHYAIYE